MELTFIEQTTAFLWSIALGALLGVLYEVFRLLREIFNIKSKSLFVADFIYALICGIAFFYFSLAFVRGYIRIYIFIGGFFGFLLYYFTVGRLLHAIYKPIILFFKKISSKIQRIFEKTTKKLLKKMLNILYNVFTKISIYFNKRKELRKQKRVVALNEKKNKKVRKPSDISNRRRKCLKRD